MKRIMVFSLLVLFSATVVEAEIYTWVDEHGMVTYTDNPARIPSGYIGRTHGVEKKTISNPKVQKNIKSNGKKRVQSAIPNNRIKSVQSRMQHTSVSLEMQSEIKGHLGGDQKDPAPPSMIQPKPIPLGDQPKPTSPGMNQPKPIPLSDQPNQTPSGMKQPTPLPIGDQPPPTSSGMEQPDSKK